MKAWVVYRGPLERSRLSYLLQGVASVHGPPGFIWIFPGLMTDARLQAFKQYIQSQPVREYRIIQASLGAYFRTRRQIRSIITEPIDTLVCVGFSALWFSGAATFRKLVWCVNGVPEEKELTSGRSRLFSKLSWAVCRLATKPDLIVVVSHGMKDMVENHFSDIAITVAPTCVDISTFRKVTGRPRRYFTYLGTGAVWQALDLLSPIWQALHRLDPMIRFRVISRDPRAKILARGISEESIEFVGSDDFERVAEWLNEAEAGFLVRRDTLVNRVSFPTKLAEYLASGAWVVASDFSWDVKTYMDEYRCGLLIRPDGEDAAVRILEFRTAMDKEHMAHRVKACADALDRAVWNKHLKDQLGRL